MREVTYLSLIFTGFLGCANLKQAGRGDITYVTTYAGGRGLELHRPLLCMCAATYCQILHLAAPAEQASGHFLSNVFQKET